MTDNQSKRLNVAVLYVHGQGEQAPMQDLRELAEALLVTGATHSRAYHADRPVSAPVDEGDQPEQQRILSKRKTRKWPDGKDSDTLVDIYQLYWADLVRGNRFDDLLDWFVGLFQREDPDIDTPERLKDVRSSVMIFVWVFALFSGGLALISGFRLISIDNVVHPSNAWALFLVGSGLGAVVLSFHKKYRLMAGLFGILALALSILALFLAAKVVYGRTQLIECMTHLPRAHILEPRFGPYRKPETKWDAYRRVLQQNPTNSNFDWRLAGLSDVDLNEYLSCRAIGKNKNSLLVVYGRSLYFATNLLNPTDGYGRRVEWPKFDNQSGIHNEETARQIRNYVIPLDSRIAWLTASISLFVVVVLIAVATLMCFLLRNFLLPVMTDSARLLAVGPEHVEVREKIRSRGMKLLKMLHESERKYDRVIVVAHSLGTVVAYGLLNQFWGHRMRFWPEMQKGERLEKAMGDTFTASAALRPCGCRTLEFRSAQSTAFLALQAADEVPRANRSGAAAWLVSDFVTLGSPLTYAKLLLAPSADGLKHDIESFRSRAACPPAKNRDDNGWMEEADPCRDGEAPLRPHEAAVFSVCRWTNLYFDMMGSKGDFIGGPLCGTVPDGLGLGILDVPLDPEAVHGFHHVLYWNKLCGPDNSPNPKAQHIECLRAAVGLDDSVEANDGVLAARGHTSAAAKGNTP